MGFCGCEDKKYNPTLCEDKRECFKIEKKIPQTLKQNLAFKQGLNPCLHKFDLLFFAFVWENGGNGW